jgi:hypothetical protein
MGGQRHERSYSGFVSEKGDGTTASSLIKVGLKPISLLTFNIVKLK